MASRVEYAVSMTPVRTIAASGDYDAQDVIATDIGKSLGGSGSVATTSADHGTTGYASKTVAYGNCPVNSGTPANYLKLGADAADYNMVFIKHTGKEYSTATTLGVDNDQGLIVYIETTAEMATSAKFTIPSKGAVCIPSIDLGTAMSLWCESAGANTIAVEYALVL